MPYQNVATGKTLIEDDCTVVTVWNYSATAIADGSSLIHDDTNFDATKPNPAVKTIASANHVGRCGIAKGQIPGSTTNTQGVVTPGVGKMAIAGYIRGVSASTAFTLGQQVATGATAGQVAVSTTAGAILGSIAHAETTTTPLILVSLS